MIELTDWFPRSSVPVRVGVYRTRVYSNEEAVWFQYWTGREWKYSACTVAGAYDLRARATSFNFVEWCGLAKEPK